MSVEEAPSVILRHELESKEKPYANANFKILSRLKFNWEQKKLDVYHSKSIQN